MAADICPLEYLGGEVEDGLDKLEVVVPGLQVDPLGEGDERGAVLGQDLLLPHPQQEGDDSVLLHQPPHQLCRVTVDPLQEQGRHDDELQPRVEHLRLQPGGKVAGEVLYWQVLHLQPRFIS